MLTLVNDLFDSGSFMPHGHCYLWRPDVLWTLVISNAAIALAYYSIPAALIYLVRMRKDLVFNWVFVMFGIFILACGTGHLVDILTVWKPFYHLDAAVKFITAGASVATAIAVWPLIPKALALPSHSQLEQANQRLSIEIAERRRAEEALREAHQQLLDLNRNLERRVETRTQELEASRTALVESHERFRVLAETIPQIVWATEPGGTNYWLNRHWYDFTGLDSQSRDGPSATTLLHPEDRVQTETAWQRAVASGEVFDAEFRIMDRYGRYRWFLARAQPIRNPQGEITQWCGTCTDIDERKQASDLLETRVRERTLLLEEANRELEAFSYSVSHDLRAPMRHIAGYAELLQKTSGSQLNETSQRYIKVIAKAATNAGRLVDDLLSFSRMGRTELRRESIDLAAMVKDVISELEPELHPRSEGHEITWEIADLPKVTGDRPMLRIVMLNLLSNAIKYSRNKEKAVISISSSQTEREVIFAVRDNGAGFDMRYADKLFGVFQRLHRPDEYEGNGIGLANVRRIVIRHGGRVWAEAAVDQGATFYVALPEAP